MLVPIGQDADRVLVAICDARFVATVAGLYRLGRSVLSPLVGAIAAALLLTRLDFPYLAARGYVDIAYPALIVWAAALEVERPRRGGIVWVLLALASMLRPDAWLLAGAYWLALAPRATWRRRARLAAYAAIGPAVWALVDAAVTVTGDPMYSLNYTTASARELGRRQEWWELPGVTVSYLELLTKWPVLVASAAGVALALGLARRRTVVPLALLAVGLATFLGSSLRGFSVIYRHLMSAALVLLGDELQHGLHPRGARDAALGARAAGRARHRPARRGRTVRPAGGRSDRGVALYVQGSLRFTRQAAYGPDDQADDSPLIQVPGPAMALVARTKSFAAYASC